MITAADFRERLEALGANTPSAAARVLGMDPGAVWRIWHGVRPVSPRTETRLAAAELGIVRALTLDEARVLEDARKPGDALPRPEPRSNFDGGIDWDAVYDALHADGILTFDKRGTARITSKGWTTIRYYLARQTS
jgi:hypothetical protein